MYSFKQAVKFDPVNNFVVVDVISSKHDAGVGSGERGQGEPELVKVQSAVVVNVDNVPVLDAKVVEELLGRVCHANEVSGLVSALTQLIARDIIVPIAVAEVPQLLELFLVDLQKFHLAYIQTKIRLHL